MRFDSFDHLLSHWARETPDACALRHERGACTFRQLYELVQTRAETLRRSGKTCLGILSDGSFDCVVNIFAANLAGLQIVMLDENAPEDTLRQLIRYTDIDTLWGDVDLADELSDALTTGVTDGAGRILFFTSGTTEQARAVVLTDHSLCQSAWNGSEKLPLSPADTLLNLLPLGHVFGFVCGLLWGLSCGAAVALGRGARHYADDCAFFRPTAVSVVPMLLGFLMKLQALNPELKLILVGAGDCPPQLLAAAAAQGIRVSFGYGLTETSSGVAISVSGDPFAMEICPDDTVTLAEDGEILIQAPTCMMQGYYKLPDATAAVLQGGVLHTGDLGYLDEAGRLHVTGRKKEMLVLSDGTKLYLPEYEQALSDALGGEPVCVLLINDLPILVLEGGMRDAAPIWAKIRPVLDARPRNQQIRFIEFYEKPLPRTASGKIMRWAVQREREGL